MSQDAVPRWVQSLGDLATRLQGQKNTAATLATIVDGAAGMVPGARWTGITVISENGVDVAASTDAVVADLAAVQAATGDGPGMVPMRRHRRVHIPDLAVDDRWPEFTRAGLAHGVRSALLFRLFAEKRRVGVLTLYGDRPGIFAADSLVIGDILAQHASSAMLGATAEEQFNQALSSRDVIGQAKGILMHERRLDGLQAFELIVRTSQEANIKVVDLARWLVEQHESSLTDGA
jgi:GAF domain-containing protein